MKRIEDVTACVVDSGLFLNMARRLSLDCNRVFYYNPDTRAWPSIRQAVIGDGFPGIYGVDEFWPYFKEIDLFCFPDVQLPELQLYLRSQGKSVWGAGRGMDLELNRQFFLRTLDELGLQVPPHTVVNGHMELEKFLKDKEDQYIKISKFRGDMETFHWRNYKMDVGYLHQLAVGMGPLVEKMQFIVCPAIDADVEIGSDTYCVDGQWPDLMLNGVEGKDKSYLGAVTKRSEMPDQILEVMHAFSSVLRDYQYRQQWSCELRLAGEDAFFIDATQRGGMPSTGSQHSLWSNFSEIVWAGAHGEIIQPKPDGKFSMETMITTKESADAWKVVELPTELEGIVQFNTCAFMDGAYIFPPTEYDRTDLGWLVSIGNSPTEVLEKQKKAADLLPDGLNADVESLASVIEAIDNAQEEGLPFTQQELPEPAEVL